MSEVPRHCVSAGVVVVNPKKEILLIKGPRRGWEPPGGIVELGESIEVAAIREVKEETGIDIRLVKFCGIFQNLKTNVVNTVWLASPSGGAFRTSSESLEVGYFSVSEALDRITWKNFRQRVDMALDDSTHPFFVAW